VNVLRENPTLRLLCPPHELVWIWTWASIT